MNNIDAITGNKFPVFNFGSDLMKFKFLLVLTMVLCAFCVLPVNAINIIISPTDFAPGYIHIGNVQPYEMINIHAEPYAISLTGTVGSFSNDVTIIADSNEGDYERTLYMLFPTQGGTIIRTAIVYYTVHIGHGAYDIIVEENENIIKLGNINDLNQIFSIGSNQNGSIKLYNSYTGINCTIDELEKTYVKVRLDENFNLARINLLGDIQYIDNLDSFNTHALIYYNYSKPLLPTNEITAYIQTFDYQNGNMLFGVNLSVYEVIDHDTYAELGQLVYSSTSANSQTVLQLKNNTDYFVINNLDGYYAVKNTVYPYFNGLDGYWWSLPYYQNPLLLYYSKLDASAQYNANFIVHDTNQNGLSGVSVTMDNSQTLITNNIGGVSFQNVSAGSHTFVFVKNGYQTAQRTINIQMQYASFDQVLYKDNQIIQSTVQPTAYPTLQPTVQPTYTPIDQPSNLAESVKYGLAKMFGVNSLNSINLIFALLIILFPAVVAGVITNQALGFIAGGLIGFVFALGIGLIPLWVFFSMIMLSVIYLVMTHTESGF